jgi:hypothetical protein
MAPKNEAARVVEVECSDAAVEWTAITAGALAAVDVSIILITLGPGIGLATVSPWSFSAAHRR